MALHADGTVDVYCRYCGKLIGRFLYQGFTVAECMDCQQAQKRLQELPPDPGGIIKKEESK